MNLTKDQLKQNAAAMVALAAGQPIQFRHLSLSHKWEEYMPTIASAPNWSEYEYRPAPDPIAPGHNPDKLTVSQVGEGWRIVDSTEGANAEHSKAWHDATEFWYHDSRENKWGFAPHSFDGQKWFLSETLRTRLTRKELAALDKPKPKWQLPAPPAGKRWHRDDFTEVDLPEGWRPLLMGEAITKEDEFYHDSLVPSLPKRWASRGSGAVGVPVDSDHFKHRTRRPLPSAPVMVPWDSPEDVPGPVCYLRRKVTPCGWAMITSANVYGLGQTSRLAHQDHDAIQAVRIPWAALVDTEYSTDRVTWKPCTKEAKA